ncbi:MAG: PAS domain S-box protein [Chitinophagaceae bacterium]|nr:PAS domain S-box protein [Chitinophagaceae bacterium]
MSIQKQIRDIIQDLPNAIYTCDELGYVQTYNKAAVELWGRKPVAGKDRWSGSWKIYNTDGSSLSPEDSPMAITLKERRPLYGKEIIIKRPDSSLRHVIPYPSPLYNDQGQLTGAINILIDITESRLEQIKEENSYKELVEEAADGIFLFDQQGGFVSVNSTGCSMLGYSKDELSKLNLADIIPVVYTGKLPVNMEKLKDGNAMLVERQFVKSDGTVFFAEVSARLASNGNIQAIVRDITERKQTEQKQVKTLERHHMLTEATTDTIWDWDIVNNKMFYNEGITKLLGYEVSEIKNLSNWWKKNIHPDDFERVCKTVDEVFKIKKHNSHLTYRFKCADDSYKFIYDRWLTIFDKYGRPERMVGVMQDVTRHKDEDVRISKLIIETQESERRLIGTELHDNVNQILTGCLLNLAMIKSATPERATQLAETSREYILTAIGELRNLTHRLVPANKCGVSATELFEDLILSMNIHRQFKINTHFEQLKTITIGDEIQLNLYRMLQEQLTNIVKYSRATTIDISICVRNNNIVMRIYDNGKGFDAQLVRMGIGLSNIKHRIQLLDGEFVLNTSEGNGCEIIAAIPVNKQVIAA